MGKKYIIKLDDNNLAYTAIMIDGVPYIKPLQLLPYTEPDLDAVRKEAYQKGWKAAEDNYDSGYSDGYDAGLDDIWKAVRKIQEMDIDTLHEIFGWVAGKKDVFIEYTAVEVIEKLRAYEQEQDEKKKTDYYFKMMKDAIETSAKEYGMSLDEVAAVLDKMRACGS